MSNEFSGLSEEEQLKAENDILKMRMMLEHGAKFMNNEKSGNMELPAEIENDFLNHIMEFEKQFAERKMISVAEKIPGLSGFKNVADLKPDEYEQAWKNLREYLNHHGIDLHACSGNVSSQELYRFVLEEMVDLEIDDISIPGMMTGFIYDEFYPDPAYESGMMAEKLFEDLFGLGEFHSHFLSLHSEEILFNELNFENIERFKSRVEVFKSFHEELELKEFGIHKKDIDEDKIARITGSYKAEGRINSELIEYTGSFNMRLVPENKSWYVKEVFISGLLI